MTEQAKKHKCVRFKQVFPQQQLISSATRLGALHWVCSGTMPLLTEGLPSTLALRSEMTAWAEDFSACPDLSKPLKMGEHEPCCSYCRDKNEDNHLSQTFWVQIVAQSLQPLSHRQKGFP